jgi:phosphate transport system substrate-binding protein
MKRYLWLATLLIVALFGVACGGATPTEEEAAGPGGAEGDLTFGVVLVGPRNDRGWSQAHYDAGLYVEENVPGTELIYIDKVNPADRPGTTAAQLGEDLLGQGADLIIFNSDDMKDGALEFAENNPEVSFNLTRDGSGGGFENVFIPGDSDMNNASRPIGEDELQRCRDNGIEPVEFFLAQDALTVVVNNNADFIDSISLEDLGTIWSPDTAPETWADVNSDWPDEPFDLYGPASTSGTYDYFTETVIGETESDQPIRDDFEGTEEDDLIASGVEGNRYALGYLPFAYYTNNPDSTKALRLSQDDGEPVEPSLEGAQSGDYPLARPLFFYANSDKIEAKTHLQEFIEFYVESATKDFVSEDIGYVPSSQEMVENNLSTLEEYTS